MELKVDLTKLGKEIDASTWKAQKHIQDAMKELGISAEIHAKDTIDTFVDSSGNKQGVNSGLFRDSVHSTIINSGYGFKVSDGVPYGIYHEFGTEKHFVPFVDEGGSLTSLGKWAILHFDEIGFEVAGVRGKKLKRPSRKSREELIIAKGGMLVSLDEMAPFRKALNNAEYLAAATFRLELQKND